MTNEWNKIELSDYENHMSDPNVLQLQILNRITQKQINVYNPLSLVFLGVAGGNGLEYCKDIRQVYAVDINKNYLDTCLKRFPYSNIEFIHIDLNKDNLNLRNIDLVIANLIFEYINEEIVVPKISKILNAGGVLSIVFQIDSNNSFISKTKYSEKLTCLDIIHHTVKENYLHNILDKNNFTKVSEENYSLPNKKSLKRIDYKLR